MFQSETQDIFLSVFAGLISSIKFSTEQSKLVQEYCNDEQAILSPASDFW